MNLQDYLVRQRYRVPILLLATVLIILLLLNLPHQTIRIQSFSINDSPSGKPQKLMIANDRSFCRSNETIWPANSSPERFAGWPQSLTLDSKSLCYPQEWRKALHLNRWCLLQVLVLTVGITIGLQVVSCYVLSMLRHVILRWAIGGLIILGAAPLTYFQWRYCQASRCDYLAALKRGSVGYSISVPQVFTALPKCFFNPFLKIDSAAVEGLTPEQLHQLLSEASLRRLLLRNCRIEASHWQMLRDHPRLQDLTLERCSFDETPSFASDHVWPIERLTIDDCSGVLGISKVITTAEQMHSCRIRQAATEIKLLLSTMPRSHLEDLELVVSQHDEADLLKHSGARKAIGLKINGFVKLRKLTVAANEPNHSIRVRAFGCPLLESITFDKSHGWHVDLADLPRLSHLYGDQDPAMPHCWAFPSLKTLSIDSLPCLRELSLLSRDLEALKVQNCSAIKSLRLHPGEPPKRETLISTSRRACDSNACGQPLSQKINQLFNGQVWLAQLRSLTLDYHNLSHVDLKFLSTLKKLESLSLNKTDVSASQLKRAGKIDGLRTLALRRDNIDSAELNAILDQFPNLQHLKLEAELRDELELINRPHLETLELKHYLQVNRVRIEDCDRLNVALSFIKPLESLRLKNAPLIRELYVAHEVPLDFELFGVRGLQEVYVQGDSIRDSHVDVLSRCPDLAILFLSAPNVSPAALQKLRECRKLAVLLLPRCPVNDSVVDSLAELTGLCELDLSRTAITGKSLVSLERSARLMKLNLSYTDINPSDTRPIFRLTKLFHLELSGVGVDQKILREINTHQRLERLSLSHTRLSDEAVAALCSRIANGLVYLDLRSCDLDAELVERIKQAHPRTNIETSLSEMDESQAAIHRMEMVAR